MQKIGADIELSSSDLVGHLNCRFLTNLDLSVAHGELSKPSSWDPLLELLKARGDKHERNYIEHLRSEGYEVVEIDGVGIVESVVTQTFAAMSNGAQIIVQGAFRAQGWSGRTDILRKIETPSKLGSWSYEVIDTKLAREKKLGPSFNSASIRFSLDWLRDRFPNECISFRPGPAFSPKLFELMITPHIFEKLEVAQAPQSQRV